MYFHGVRRNFATVEWSDGPRRKNRAKLTMRRKMPPAAAVLAALTAEPVTYDEIVRNISTPW